MPVTPRIYLYQECVWCGGPLSDQQIKRGGRFCSKSCGVKQQNRNRARRNRA